MNEEQTKADLITPALHRAGWGHEHSAGSRIRYEFPITAESKPVERNYKQLSADYVLIYHNRILAVVEAKGRDCYYTKGLGQAEDYAQRLNVRYTPSNREASSQL